MRLVFQDRTQSRRWLLAGATLFAAIGTSWAAIADHHVIPRTPAPEGAQVYLIAPADGATVKSPLTVVFGLSGAGVAPAGVRNPKTGHHHLIIDAPTPAGDAPVPADDKHRHFGGGQTETTIELAPGAHTLQLVLGDHLHIPHDPPIVSKIITITVE
jgi:hypothetical protein